MNQPVADDVENSPVAWFCVLDRAHGMGDREKARQARQELNRLGVTVRYRRKCRRHHGK